MTKIITFIRINWVTPKDGAKHELLFNKPASGPYKGLFLKPSLMHKKVKNTISENIPDLGDFIEGPKNLGPLL